MKKSVFVLCILLLISSFLLSCGQKPTEPDPRTAPFPGTAWGMTPDELIDSLKLEEGAYSINEPAEEGGIYVIRVDEMPVFNTVADVFFRFDDMDDDGEKYYLFGLIAGLSDETDFDALIAAMSQEYGEPEEGKVLEWYSEATVYDMMAEKDKAFVDGMSSFNQEPFHGAATTIQLSIDGPFELITYKGEPTNNYIQIQNSTNRYTHGNGFPAQ